jgi:hypothetical protein
MSVKYKAVIFEDGKITTEVLEHTGDCSEINKIVQRLGTITSDEETGDRPTVHEVSSC